MTSNDIPGQGNLKKVFQQMVESERLPHAMLIHSNEGGAGLPLALYLSQLLMCENPSMGDPCGKCGECIKTQSHTHPDLHYIFPVNANKQVKKKEDRHSDSFISEWRKAISENTYLDLMDWYQAIDIENKQGFIGEFESGSLRRKLALLSFEGGHRVFIIWHADKMNDSFANKILKNLEEPSPKTTFLLISESPAKLLSTVISRVQIFREEHLGESELADFLVRKFQIEKNPAMDVAFRAEGHIGEAIKELENNSDPWLEEFKMWMRMSYARDVIGLYKWSEKMAKQSRDSQRQFCTTALRVIDRCYRMGWIQTQIPLEGSEAKFYKDFSPFINTSNALGFLDLMEKAAFHIERNVSEKIVWFDTAIESIRLVHAGKKQVATVE